MTMVTKKIDRPVIDGPGRRSNPITMTGKHIILGLLSTFTLGATLAGCSPCGSLEEKICDDLGEAECQIWKEHEMPGFPSGRRQTRQCVNGHMGAQYDAILAGARASVQAYQAAEQAQ